MIWRSARARGTGAAATATLAAPLALPLLLLQTVAGGRAPDVVTSLVDAVYGAVPVGEAASLRHPATADALPERP
jgi:hypothetical protein